MAKLHHCGKDSSIIEILGVLEQDGCLVIEDLLDQATLKTLAEELAPHFAQTPDCAGDFYGHHTKRLSGLIAKSPTCGEMALHPLVLSVMDHFLLQSSQAYQLNLTQAIQIGPGEPAQMLHADDLMFPFDHGNHQCMINCMWALDDFTKANGATRVVPGSHLWPVEREARSSEVTQAEMRAGSLLIYFAALQHGGGANVTVLPRTGVVLSYCLGWLRQAENQYLACPIEIAATLPERLQELLGYFVHAPNLGCVEGQSPMEILKGKFVTNGRFEEFLPPEARAWLARYKAAAGSTAKSAA